MSSKDVAKATRERTIFKLFAEKMNWRFSDNLIESRPKPEPDILYRGTDGPIAFELSEICAADVAQSISRIREGGAWFTATADPTANILSKKYAATHTSNFRMELLCYWNSRTASPDSLVEAEVTDFLQSRASDKFCRVWYFGENTIYEFMPTGQVIARITL